jgi:hypothetical protein
MEKQGRFVNVKSRDGRVLLSLYFNPGSGVVLESRLDGRYAQGQGYRGNRGNGNGRNGGNGKGNGYGGNGGSSDNGIGMTYPQKRLLFRLMAQEGFEGDAAQGELLRLFETDSLGDVSKQEASRMIERLLKEAKEGGDGGGIPF